MSVLWEDQDRPSRRPAWSDVARVGVQCVLYLGLAVVTVAWMVEALGI